MPETLLDPHFYINAGKDGTFKASGNYHSTPADVDAIFTYLAANDIQSLVIYFHGGLVSEKAGMNAAALMKGTFHDTAAKRHVVSFVWETGPLEVLTQNLDTFVKQDLIKTILMKVIKLAAKKLDVPLGDRGVGGYLSDEEIKKELQKKEPFANESTKVTSRSVGIDIDSVDNTSLTLLQRNLEVEAGIVFTLSEKQELESTDLTQVKYLDERHKTTPLQSDRGVGAIALIKAVATVSFKVIMRYVNKTQHDFYPTVMEEILREFYVGGLGKWGWSEIKDKAEKMFKKNDGLTGLDQFVGEYFLIKLKAHVATPTGKNMKLHLIGHSAGSIAISYLMKAAKERHGDLKFNQLFFLAPACRVDLFLQHVAPEIGTTISTFRMFTMKVEREKEDHCVPVIYTRSLLYMVSGLFEVDKNAKDDIDAKIMGLNEHFNADGRYENFDELKRLKKFLFETADQLVLSDDITHSDTMLRSTALKHGDFDNDDVTLMAIKSTL